MDICFGDEEQMEVFGRWGCFDLGFYHFHFFSLLFPSLLLSSSFLFFYNKALY